MVDKITVNEQSSIRIESSAVIYADPFRIKAAAHDADIILITHEHYDHYSPEDIAKVQKKDTKFVFPESMGLAPEWDGIPKENILQMKPKESLMLSGIKISSVPAYNLLKPFHPKKNGWLGYILELEGKRIYICGDTDDTPEARAVECDIVCVPIGGTYTMNPRKAAAFVNELSPEIAIPIHYGTIVGKPSDADEFEKLAAGDIKVVRKLFV